MAVIVIANPKGGSGKSTTCLILGTTLAHKCAQVRIIDADPQQTLGSWAEGSSAFRHIVVTPRPGTDLVDQIDELSSKFPFVLVDVQRSANQELIAAMSRADLVLIPMQAKTADAEVAACAIGLLRSQEKLFKRTIRHGVIFTRTSPLIVSREQKLIQTSAIKAGVPSFTQELNERTAYSHMFAYKQALFELPSSTTSGLVEAVDNAESLTGEMILLLRDKG